MLNKVVDNCNKSEFIALLIIWSVITFYFGYLWQKDVNYNGYNVMNFIFLYFIGRFIAMHTLNVTTTKRQFLYLGIYILCSVISTVFIITKSSDIHSITNRFYIYNSPVVFISAISFFLFFRTLKFKNRFINWIAKSALAVYLIHENRFVKEHLYGYIKESTAGIDTEWMLAVRLLFYGVVVFAACIVIDNVRFVITNPVEKFINKIKWDLYTRQFISYIAKLIK
ncbi:surface polysaccharide O-acyltransferase-like enzyme [Dysgonomonas hofstadii]|uniref:Surface polysaccharide O-acyltransferase-like enzyme n=2 Tax=Dysgonomonas hofstadii TaxID=637886 RepID=A0A840CWW1_9BACT|nr:surface polysaccharide O-acyltransferase-like enzyme [Dysgonomonas hofstadii]